MRPSTTFKTFTESNWNDKYGLKKIKIKRRCFRNQSRGHPRPGHSPGVLRNNTGTHQVGQTAVDLERLVSRPGGHGKKPRRSPPGKPEKKPAAQCREGLVILGQNDVRLEPGDAEVSFDVQG